MDSLKILDEKTFMSKLLVSDTFDKFLLLEAIIGTYSTFSIDGRLNKEFYLEDSEEDSEYKDELAAWGRVKPICYEIIKGKQLPVSFKIVLQLSKKNIEKFLNQTETGFRKEEVNGLFLNIYFDRKELKCITGTSIKTFSLDRSIEYEWDRMVRKFFNKNYINYEEN